MTTTLANYQALALRTEKPLPTSVERLAHAALGLITETGEIATEVKRMAIYGKPLDDERRAHIAEEVGDVMWYLAIASDAIGKNIFRGLMGDLLPRKGSGETPEKVLESATLALSIWTGRVSYVVACMRAGEAYSEVALADTLAGIAQELTDISGAIDTSSVWIAAANIAKLQARFPDAYSNEAAEARADKGGLDARNS